MNAKPAVIGHPEQSPSRSAVWHSTLPIQVPWTYELDDCSAKIFCPGNVTPWCMARIDGPDRQATEAYARLIAAAPDLLAALKECVWRFQATLDELKTLLAEHPIDEMQDEAANDADERIIALGRAAIAKATGGQS